MGLTKNINGTVKGAAELARKLKKLTGLPRLMMIPLVAKYALKIQGAARKAVKVDQGFTRGSILTTFSGGALTAEIGSTQKTAVWIEQGTGPAAGHAKYFPPPDALLPWMSRHGITPKKGETQMGIAWMIARSIYNKGTKPSPFLGPAFDEYAPQFVEAAKLELGKGFEAEEM